MGTKNKGQIIQHGDNVKLMAKLASKSVQLIIADPPYNRGMDYDSCDDKKSYEQYMLWTRTWMVEAVRLLHPHGAFWLFIPDEWVSEIDIMARHELKLHKRRHVIWAFTF